MVACIEWYGIVLCDCIKCYGIICYSVAHAIVWYHSVWSNSRWLRSGCREQRATAASHTNCINEMGREPLATHSETREQKMSPTPAPTAHWSGRWCQGDVITGQAALCGRGKTRDGTPAHVCVSGKKLHLNFWGGVRLASVVPLKAR